MKQCQLCADRRDHLILRQCRDLGGHFWWELALTDQPGHVARGGVPGKQAVYEHRYQLCVNGHFWPSAVDNVVVIRLLGATAAGKTILLRNLHHQMMGGVVYRQTPPLCARAFDRQVHARATLMVAMSHRLAMTDMLAEYGSSADELTGFLEGIGIHGADLGKWGDDERLPYHLLTTENGKFVDTIFVDPPGEAMASIVKDEVNSRDAIQLLNADGLLWVVDAAVLPAVRSSVVEGDGGRLLVESLRPELFINEDKGKFDATGWPAALERALESANGRYNQTDELAQFFAKTTELLDPMVFKATALTKADLIWHMLAAGERGGRPGWASAFGVSEVKFMAGGRTFLKSYVNNLTRITADAPTANLLRHLQEAVSDSQLFRRRCDQVVRGVLAYYADPDRFSELVLEEPDYADELEILHLVDCPGAPGDPTVWLEIAPMAMAWEQYRARGQRALQPRDLAVGIIVRCILGTTQFTKPVSHAEAQSVVHYFLTAPFNAEEHLANPYSSISLLSSPGVQHLLAWVMG